MTERARLGNDVVEVELGEGVWHVRWPLLGIGAGPLSARVHVDGEALRTTGTAGRWDVDPVESYGRPGTRARWTGDVDGLQLTLHVPSAGAVVIVQAEYMSTRARVLERLIPLTGVADLGAAPSATARLVNGYDSWAYAGVQPATRTGISWWGTTLARRAPGGTAGGLSLQALDARRLATAVATRATDDGVLLDVSCGATPSVETTDGSWGYTTLPPPGLRFPLAADTRLATPPIALATGDDALSVTEELAALAGRVSGARSWPGAPVAGWESWYHYGLLIDQDRLLDNARALRERYADRAHFDVVQLDDGWQVTYGAWWPNDRFPDDLGELTARLRAMDTRPGLWLAPFMVQPGAPGVGTDHPDWAIRDEDGQPLLDRHGRWGIDASSPGALDWLRGLGTQVRTWGFEMVKLDFLYLAAVEGVRHDPAVTGTDALARGLRAMVDGLGDDVYVLGCGMPLLPAVGVCHGNRVGHDLAVPVLLREFGHPVREGWTGFAGIRPQARNVAARAALHRRWFDADPDVVMAWGSDSPITDGGYTIEESRTLATIAALCGGPFLLADELATLTPAERAVVEHAGLLELTGGDGFRPVDLFEHLDDPTTEQFFDQPAASASVWAAERSGRHVVALFNWSDEPTRQPVPGAFVGTPELWTGRRVAAGQLEIPAHAVRVLVEPAPGAAA